MTVATNTKCNTNFQLQQPTTMNPKNILWFIPPFSKNEKTNIGRTFLNVITLHFPKGKTLPKIFNPNNVKFSYSCSRNMNSIVTSHSKKLLTSTTQQLGPSKTCLTSSIVYKATITTIMIKKTFYQTLCYEISKYQSQVHFHGRRKETALNYLVTFGISRTPALSTLQSGLSLTEHHPTLLQPNSASYAQKNYISYTLTSR